MATKSIAAVDTHRCQYQNGKLTAFRGNTTVSLKFYDGADNELGYVVHINAKGYFCNQNGDLYSNGVFVREDATIRYTAPDGATTSWTVKGPIDTDVNDGRLLDLIGNVVWSANSGNDYTLNYEDLANKPTINEWAECDQLVNITSVSVDGFDTVTIDRHTKILTVIASDSIGSPSQLSLKLTPEVATRWGQVIEVKNETSYPLWLFNENLSIAAVVKPLCRATVTYGIDKLYTSESIPAPTILGGISHTVRDGCQFHLRLNGDYTNINAQVQHYTLKLENNTITMFVFEWIPKSILTNSALLVRVTGPDDNDVKHFWVKPYSSVVCIAGTGGKWLSTVGDAQIGEYIETQSPANKSGSAAGKYEATFRNETDTAILTCGSMGPGGDSGTPVVCDFYFNFNANRKKPITILVANVTYAYVAYRVMNVKVGDVATPINFGGAEWGYVMQPKNISLAEQSYMKFLKIELHFPIVNGVMNCIATANWTGTW